MARRHVIASPKRFAPLAAAAVIALVGGVAVGASYEPPEKRTVTAFTQAWERGDHRAMYALLSDDARKRTTYERLQRTYRRAADTLTLTRVRAGAVEQTNRVAITLDTKVFGALRGVLVVPIGEREGQDPGVDWRAELVYPGLHAGETLKRETSLPERASILARDGKPLAEGPDRLSELGPLASEIAGRVGPAPEERKRELAARGLPKDAQVGLTGLEREFDERLAGTPGGVLYAGGRVLARKAAIRGADVRSSIDPELQRAAIEALAGRLGGIAAVAPKTGEVLALAGIAQSTPQPPGSVFKIITLAGALQHKAVKRSDTFEVTDRATIEGVDIQNANGEFCGGTLRNSFAHSCNSVFAPMGAKLGAQKLVETAEAFGFNQPPGLAGAARSTIPLPDEIGDDLAIGSSAIGQGKVLATPLQMALVGATIAAGGVKPKPTLLRGDDAQGTRVLPKGVASTVKSYMRSVVTDGTGTAAGLDGVKVSGKTGTAELRTTVKEEPPPEDVDPNAPPVEDDTTDTNAWFVAFAPYSDPEIALAVLFVAQGTGGDTAAPAARVVLDAAF
ncbi:penicillin-binding protein 2 [Solirubrobacter sp. CPCC 204708]|uniref:Penicillin-binding transpeptidase domain-containing protein n=1 Tax=Solirubrobacter deserti TaxID=2282478 RepID=A0ABT4RT64_9ACTN|nr:penicillin-binding transpeptidase domain-containing protein [Solirubrobacter deserti]MBE2318454.1 penicillin-binding protein 2 [Solirubrobacter deserti]MDA0141772.1 penicillin-binding transpeptidase domain-containing protein [Solirubrobacter deserti]